MTTAPVRTVTHTKETSVRHVANPVGPNRENGVHLRDLRAFVQACDGLPDDLLVHIDKGHMSEGGRYDTTLRVTHREPTAIS